MVEGLTDRQRQILELIAEAVDDRGYPPSVREICEELGLASSSTAHSHLQALQKKGYLRIDPTKPRAIEILFDAETGLAAERRPARSVPLVGRIAAGSPILAEENVEEIYPMPGDLVGDGTVFMLEVSGDSMIDEGIHDGDFIIVLRRDSAEPGEMVVALIGDDATLTRYYPEGDVVRLQPANPTMLPIRVPARDVRVQGVVVGLMRKF